MNLTPHLLIIDDDISIRTFLKKFLVKQGFDVTMAADGLEGIELAQKIQPDLIIMDVVMPNIDGVETGRRLRKLPDLRTTPIIYLSAAYYEEEMAEKKNTNNEAFLMKPFDVKQLIRVIGEFTGQGE